MVDVLFVPRKRWRRAHWRIASKRRAWGWVAPIKSTWLARYALSRASRIWDLVVLAIIVVGAVLLNLGYLKDAAGLRTTERLSAMAIDGDTLRAGSTRIRLIGIDAPELSQTCREENGRIWLCGSEAHARLRSLVGFGMVECQSSSTDRYGRPLAVCSTGSVPDIGEAMVRSGYAVSFMSPKYWLAELSARYHKRGMWRGSFVSPADWRRGHRDAAS